MSNNNVSLNDIIWSTTESDNIIFYFQRYIILKLKLIYKMVYLTFKKR